MNLTAWPAWVGLAAILTVSTVSATEAPYGIPSRIESQNCLNMPSLATGAIPKLLSQTGAFANTPDLAPSRELIPYDLVVPFWSDGATKVRWVAIPKGKVDYSETGDWKFPACTVFVKNFELPTDARNPQVQRAWKRGCWFATAKAASMASPTNGVRMDAMPIWSPRPKRSKLR